jgi:hypothetical protein
MKLSQALKILSDMKTDRHIDPDIYDLVLNSPIFFEYAKANMNPEQLDDLDLLDKDSGHNLKNRR